MQAALKVPPLPVAVHLIAQLVETLQTCAKLLSKHIA